MNQEKNRKPYILDTSALLTYIEDEDGSDEVEELLVKAEKGEVEIYIAFVSITEDPCHWSLVTGHCGELRRDGIENIKSRDFPELRTRRLTNRVDCTMIKI
jgi:PIN domain nuclease of toxin-antitoxin system